MTHSQHIAKHLREVFFGGNWTFSNLMDNLKDVTWEQATMKVYTFNTIAVLTYHISYFVTAIIKVLERKVLDSKDIYSFDHPPINSQEDWDNMLAGILSDAEYLATLIEQVPEERLWEVFVDPKYGIYYRNFHGLIEHTHYHLGQIVIIKKLVNR